MKEQILAIGAIATGIVACGAVFFLQGGGLVSEHSASDVQLLSAPVTGASVAVPQPSASAEPVAVRPRHATPRRGAGRQERCRRQALETGGFVVVCDGHRRTVKRSPEYRKSGGLVGDYREDFLEALED